MKPIYASQVQMLEQYMDRHDELLKLSRATYETWGPGVDDLPFQRSLVDQALRADRWWTAELATGIGKSVIAARIALERCKEGPVVFVCPSSTALGDESAGIVNKFSRVFRALGCGSEILGRVNDLSRANDVSFVTPRVLSRMLSDGHGARTLSKCSTLIVDEAHHFPEDRDDDLILYGGIYRVAQDRLRHGLTIAMTGTWERLDRMRVMGVTVPDARITVQDAVDLRRCPEVYGIQVVTDVRAEQATARGNLYDIHLLPEERARYLQGVVECVIATRRRYPVPFAVFTRTQSDAIAIASRFNEQSGLNDQGVAVLTAHTPMHVRRLIVERVSNGTCAGYITCGVGEESLDLPSLQVIHLVRRTKSNVRNMQAIGRSFRVHPGKQRSLVVDYQTALDGVTERFLGVTLDDVADAAKAPCKPYVNGGPLVCQRSYPVACLVGITMREERAIICARTLRVDSAAAKKQELIVMAQRGDSRPSKSYKLELPPDQYALVIAFHNYTTPTSRTFDAAFTTQLRELAPSWFIPRRQSVVDAMTEIRRLAHAGAPRPPSGTKLGNQLCNYATRPDAGNYDEKFASEIRALRPDWFQSSADKMKEVLLAAARGGESRPRLTSPDAEERRRAHLLWKYTNPNSKIFDAAFAEAIRAAGWSWQTYKRTPDWKKRYWKKRCTSTEPDDAWAREWRKARQADLAGVE